MKPMVRHLVRSHAAVWVAASVIAVGVLSGCGGDDSDDANNAEPSATTTTTKGRVTVASSTTSTTRSTTTTTEAPAIPAISAQALNFLDCDELVEAERWECHRGGGVAFITVSNSLSVGDYVSRTKADPLYDSATSLLFQTSGGYIFIPGFDGFEHVHTHSGPIPGMTLIDTDQY